MGSTCSSAQKKAGKGEEERRASMLSTDSIPYGGGNSPRSARKSSNNRPAAPPPEVPSVTQVNNSKPQASETTPSNTAPSTATPNSANISSGHSGGPPPTSSSPCCSEGGLPDLAQFPEDVLPLLMGRWDDTIAPPSRKEITLYIGGCYSGPLRGNLWSCVFPHLRTLCSEKGYSLLVVDVEDAQTVLWPKSKGGLIDTLDSNVPLLFMLLVCEGCSPTVLPPAEISKEDFESALQPLDEAQKELLTRNYSPREHCFCLKRTNEESHLNLVNALKGALPNKDIYLKPELEKELRWILECQPGMAKRTLWLQLPSCDGLEESPQALQLMKGKLQELIPDSQRHLVPAAGISAAPEMLVVELKKMLEGIIEDEFAQACRMPYKGMEDQLYEELQWQAFLCQQLNSSALLHHQKELSMLKDYICQEGSEVMPLILHGTKGSGKTRLLSALMQEACLCLSVTTPLALNLLQQGARLRSTSEHLCALYGLHPSNAYQLYGEEHPLQNLLSRANGQRPLVLVIDDFEPGENSQMLKLLSSTLPAHIKVVLTLQTGSSVHNQLQNLLEGGNSLVDLNSLTPEHGLDLVQALSFPLDSESVKSVILDHFKDGTTPAHAALIAHWLKNINSSQLPNNFNHLVTGFITKSGNLGLRILSYLTCVRHGLTLPELLELMVANDDVALTLSYWHWINVSEILGPLVRKVLVRQKMMLTLNAVYADVVRSALDTKVVDDCKEKLKLYFAKPDVDLQRQVVEMPFLQAASDASFRDKFLLNSDWLCKGADLGVGPSVLLEDVHRALNAHPGKEDLELNVLCEVLESCVYALHYDGSQFLCQLYRHLLHHPSLKACPNLQRLLKVAARPPKPSLLPIRVLCKTPGSSPTHTEPPTQQQQAPQVLHTMRGSVKHMLSLSPKLGQVTVWDVYAQKAVRTLTGVFEPKDAKMVDDKRCLLLCNRELKLYDLDEGCLVLKLKGVMNQHMAYFGLRNSSYVVALSRNRMYVNMMNLKTGDLETTFKVGEDRFLNSLLVSGNGKICVCGDETQKPFPLLVWDLDNRKLLYDLRIPHHEFLTHLSAISHDGHYVVCVCKELEDGSPNFIIVYDLQSGTLFKKWKPESDSCSIAISAPHGVVNGLNNSLVLVWDLVTGARKFNFRGHSAPVDQIKMDSEGSRCLTFDSTGKDRSIRLWGLAQGECLAVLTPDVPLTCAQLTLDGGAVVMGFKGSQEVVTYVLCHQCTVQEAIPEEKDFGDPQRRGITSDVSKQG